MIFVDWLSMYQDFPDSFCPILASEIRTTRCALTGELLNENTTGYQHPGSFDSSLLIKFDGQRLTMSGNPSAFNCRDNLFGVATVHAAVDVFNAVLEKLGYPQFYDCENTNVCAMPLQSSYKYSHPGLVITRVDLTKNFCSDTNPLEMLRYLSTFSYRGQCGYLYPNGRTVDWMGDRNGETGGSKRLYFKYYDKSWDISKKLKKLEMRRLRMTAEAEFYTDTSFIDTQIAYLTRLLQYTLENNVVRFELELKAKTLAELKLNRLVGWNREMNIILLEKYMPHMAKKLVFNRKIDLYSQLLEAGEKPGASTRNAALLGSMWLDGHDIDFNNNPLIKKDAFYRARKKLLLIGFDIKQPINIINFPTQVTTFSLSDLAKPDFYDNNQVA